MSASAFKGRQTWYIGVDEIQRDLDRFMRYCNLERSHSRLSIKGRAHAKALMDALAITEIPDLIPSEEAPTSRCQRLLNH